MAHSSNQNNRKKAVRQQNEQTLFKIENMKRQPQKKPISQ